MCSPCANPPQPMIPTRRRLFAPRTLFALAAVATIEAAEADTNARRLILLVFSIGRCSVNLNCADAQFTGLGLRLPALETGLLLSVREELKSKTCNLNTQI